MFGGTGNDSIADRRLRLRLRRRGQRHRDASSAARSTSTSTPTRSRRRPGRSCSPSSRPTSAPAARHGCRRRARARRSTSASGNDYALRPRRQRLPLHRRRRRHHGRRRGYDTIVFHKAMVADWQAGVLDADIASDTWHSWEAIQGSAGADRIRTNSWGFAVELRGGGGDDVLATGVAGVVTDTLGGEARQRHLERRRRRRPAHGREQAPTRLSSAPAAATSTRSLDFNAARGRQDRPHRHRRCLQPGRPRQSRQQRARHDRHARPAAQAWCFRNVASDTLTDDLFLFAPDPGQPGTD